MAIATMDALVDGLATGQTLPFYKPSMTAKGAGTFQSLWTAAGSPGAGATPATGSGQTCSSSTTGALSFVNPTGGELTYLARALANCGVIGSLILYDRLVTTSGLSGTSTGTQTINSQALTRYTSGTGVSAWIEWYTATGATASNITLNYTNDAGATGQVAAAATFVQTPVVGQMMPLPLNGNDGIRIAESITLSASTGTAGNFGVTLMKRLLTIPLPQANSATVMDALSSGLAQIPDSSCLAFMVWCSTTSTGVIHGEISLAQG